LQRRAARLPAHAGSSWRRRRCGVVTPPRLRKRHALVSLFIGVIACGISNHRWRLAALALAAASSAVGAPVARQAWRIIMAEGVARQVGGGIADEGRGGIGRKRSK